MPDIRATVRLQFHREFTFDDATPLVAYFSQLGISHIYASPILKARAGSRHGYDVVDPTQINPELGGEPALERLVAELRRYGMGLIVDIVSNHMAVGGNDNPWWLDVLKWGQKSRYARFFDIHWNSPYPALNGQLLVPFLRSHYGEVLAAGEITVHFNHDTGEFYARHYDHHFPLCPTSYSHILNNTHDPVLQAFAQPFVTLEHVVEGWQAAEVLHAELRDAARPPAQQDAIRRALACYNLTPADIEAATDNQENGITHTHLQADSNLQRLHNLLELQPYRLASWRTAADDINWRRFFDVNELGGLRVERQEVFDAIHAKIFELIQKGLIDGLRIDHVDGLANPRAYCRKLRRRLDRLAPQRPVEARADHLPIYAEKILADEEQLPADWLLDGTTGYEFMNQVSLLQHDPKGAFQLYDLWRRVSGREESFTDEVKAARRLVLSSNLVGDVEMVAQGLLSIACMDIATRDLTLSALRRALIELVVHFPVYRTYVTVCGRTSEDQVEHFNIALEGAKSTLAEADWPLLDYLNLWLGSEALHSLPPGEARSLRRKVLTRFQQLTSPAAAKAVEDTACYRSAVLLSRNDVGFDPQRFSAPPEQFHARNTKRLSSFPHNLLATATHDHKRGEDTRARLAVISERSVWFTEKIAQWQALCKPLRVNMEDGPAPSPGDELMLYQTLLGCWPPLLEADDKAGLETFLKRILQWQQKAIREAKLRSHWSLPNEEYESVCATFVTRILTDDSFYDLRHDIAAAAASLAPAGVINSLGQTLLRMTCPGVPDLYQGAEGWDFSLVDPDNRQAVDFASYSAALNTASKTPLSELIPHWKDGRLKQRLIQHTLNARKNHPALFAQGSYHPLEVVGTQADHIIAFAREYQEEWMLVVVPRLTASLLSDNPIPLIPTEAWGDTAIKLPAVLTGQVFTPVLFPAPSSVPSPVTAPFPAATVNTQLMPVSRLLGEFPVHIAIATAITTEIPMEIAATITGHRFNQPSLKNPNEGVLQNEHS